MKCIEVRELLEQYYHKGLNEENMEMVCNHLEKCESCRYEYDELMNTIGSINNVYENIEIPDELTNIEAMLPSKPRCKSMWVKRTALIASVLILILSVFYSPIVAKVLENIHVLEKYFTFGDKGIIRSLENGFGQVVNKSDENNGIKFTVRNVISDQNRTVILFSAKILEDIDADYGQITGFFIKNQFGQEIRQHSAIYTFYKEKNEVAGRFEIDSLGFLDRKLTFGIKGLILTDRKEMELDLDLTKTQENYNRHYDLGIESIKDFTINSVENTGQELIIKYTVEMKEGYKHVPKPQIKLLNGDQEVYMTYGSSYPRTDKQLIEEICVIFDIKGMNIKNVKSILQYSTLQKKVNGEWEVSFYVDRDKAKDNTFERKINKDIEIDGNTVTIDRMVVTPSQTTIYILYDVYTPFDYRLLIDQVELVTPERVYAGFGKRSNSNREKQEVVFMFEPLEKLEDVKLRIGKVRKIKHANKKITVNLDGEDQLIENYDLSGVMVDINAKKLGNDLVVKINTGNKDFLMVNGAYILYGQEKIFAEIETEMVAYKGRKGKRTIMTFKNIEKVLENQNTVELHINAFTVYEDIDMEIELN